MVEFQAPPNLGSTQSAPTTKKPLFDDSETVKRDRADLVELMNAYEAERASARLAAAAPAAIPGDDPSTRRVPNDAVAEPAADVAKTIVNPGPSAGAGSNQLSRTIAEATPFGATMGVPGGGQAFDKTISDGESVARAREMVLGAIRDGNVAPPQPASIRPEPPSLTDSAPVRASQRPPSDLQRTRADAFMQAQHRAQAFEAVAGDRSPMSESVGSTPPPGAQGPIVALAPPMQQPQLAQSAPMQSAPMQSAPMQSAPMQSAPMQSAPMQSAPMQSAPMQSAPGASKTMLGVAAVDLASINAAHPPAHPPAPAQGAPMGGASKTMLGVAIPGIAPLNPGVQQQAPQQPSQAPAFHSQNKTMMGVAMPGIAPTHQQHHQQNQSYRPPPSSQVAHTMMGVAAPQILPMPAPYVEDPIPMAPVGAAKRGVPIVAAIGFIVLLLVGGAVAMFILYKGAPPVTAAPELDSEGRDVLRLTCEGCVDGTKISVGTASATLAKHEAKLLLPTPLKVGQNPLVLKIDRPGGGRDEDAKIEVPVAFRLRADLSTLSAQPPTITVRVEAQPGSDIRIADKPIALDAKGEGALAVDVGPDTVGPSDETKRIDRTIEYAITPKGGAPQKGSVRAQAGIAALHIDTPSSHAIVEQDSTWLSGQTIPLAEVTINKETVTADAAGLFALQLKSLPLGETKIHVVSSPKNFAARTLDFAITRVAHLEDAAKAFESEGPLGYDAYSDGTSGRNGSKVAVDGEVVEARRGTPHQWLLLVESKRGCAKLGQCLVRVQAFGEGEVTRGDHARIYGRFLHSVTAAGKTIPEVAADIVLLQKGAL
jgi:hypothetical protein